MRRILTFLLAFVCAAVHADDERFFIDAKINGQSVRFDFDTGTEVPFLLSSAAAQKLHLKVARPSGGARIGPGQTRIGWTDSQKVDFGFTNIETSFAVAELPAFLVRDLDGMIGWPAFSNNVLFLDCVNHAIDTFTNRAELSNGWVKCRIQSNSDLTLQLPSQSRQKPMIALDSGTTYGVKLNPQKWREWEATHTNQPMTLEAYYTPNPGLVVSEETWADKISLGRLTLTDVPVMEANSSDVALHLSSKAQYEATLGFAALKRMDIVIDGKHGVAYLRPKKTPPLPYEYNRLGAVFVPKTLQSDDLVAHVVKGKPAYEAGVRDGDILLKEDGRDVTNWRDPNVKINTPFTKQPAGTKFELTLKRGDKIFQTTATLRNIFPPDPTENSK